MKKINLWMCAAILTFCGTTAMLTSCAANEDNTVVPVQQTDREVGAQAVAAIGGAVSLRDSKPTKAAIDPMTEQLNQALTYTVKQRSTGKTAEGKFVTAEIEGIYQPTLALRFDGESDFQVMYDRMSSADQANLQSLLKSFDAPLRQFDKLFQAFDKKRQEFKELNPLKGL